MPNTTIEKTLADFLKPIIKEALKEELAERGHVGQPAEPLAHFPEILNRRQCAEMLGVTVQTIDSWTREGKFVKHRNGNIVRYRKSEVLKAFEGFRKYQRG